MSLSISHRELDDIKYTKILFDLFSIIYIYNNNKK